MFFRNPEIMRIINTKQNKTKVLTALFLIRKHRQQAALQQRSLQQQQQQLRASADSQTCLLCGPYGMDVLYHRDSGTCTDRVQTVYRAAVHNLPGPPSPGPSSTHFKITILQFLTLWLFG